VRLFFLHVGRVLIFRSCISIFVNSTGIGIIIDSTIDTGATVDQGTTLSDRDGTESKRAMRLEIVDALCTTKYHKVYV
jgi:glycyl-tRNA synthetase (class II)